MRNLNDVTLECADFKSEETVDPDTLQKIKKATKRAYQRQLYIGLPISILFVTLVITA